MVEPEKILKELTEGNSIYADIFEEKREYTRIHLESSRFEKIEKGMDKGVGLRTISPWKTFFASTNSTDEKHLMDIARELKRFLKKNGNVTMPEDFNVITPGYPFKIKIDPHDIDLGIKLKMVKKVEEMARSTDKRIIQVRIFYLDSRQKVNIYASDGVFTSDERKQVVLNMTVIGEEEGEMQTAYESIGGFYGFDYFTDEKLEQFVKKVTNRLKGLFTAKEAPMGIKTVVLSSEAGGTMIHEAIGHGLEADLAMEGLSCYKGMIGEKIASDLISVVDDKTIPHMRGTYACDDEGILSERTVLVENGILKNYLFDKFHAMKYGKKSTGNGRRESYRFKPIPRMSNTMILPGNANPEDIIASVDEGIFVVKMGGGQVDTVRGDFVFEITEGYIIEHGKIGDMIKNATMMGNGPNVLKEIDMVGNDLGFGIGTCGKDGQGVPVSDAQPTLRIPKIVVGGKNI
ncbi:MAG TPA: TldD/PmbA family protein [Syntrophorhabdaceae bacterium]|nr:TldD/PmbA family protein [Syntrophorhabdaceae bacterium]HPU28943.1 TldD/PmbA family protein [Syntrophorhabdaceae bacterium]